MIFSRFGMSIIAARMCSLGELPDLTFQLLVAPKRRGPAGWNASLVIMPTAGQRTTGIRDKHGCFVSIAA